MGALRCAAWAGGCIIRAAFLDRIRAAFRADPSLRNLLLDASFTKDIVSRIPALREVVVASVATGTAV